MSIDGIPDGWDLIGVRYAEHLEAFIDDDGSIAYWDGKKKSARVFPIIREIEKPKQYRPFANAAEFEPHRDRWVKRLDSLGSASRISGYGDKGVVIHGVIFTFNGLFRDHTFDDGTPFGIEVTA